MGTNAGVLELDRYTLTAVGKVAPIAITTEHRYQPLPSAVIVAFEATAPPAGSSTVAVSEERSKNPPVAAEPALTPIHIRLLTLGLAAAPALRAARRSLVGC